VAGRAGLPFPVGDVDALATTIRRLHASPNQRREMIAAGQARAAMLTWERRARGVLELLKAQAG
jgi:glycosyltransferase involved in cell wall biosynthesis